MSFKIRTQVSDRIKFNLDNFSTMLLVIKSRMSTRIKFNMNNFREMLF